MKVGKTKNSNNYVSFFYSVYFMVFILFLTTVAPIITT